MKRELQVAFETDPHLHGLDLGGMQKKIKVEVDEQEQGKPENQEYPGHFDHLYVDEDDEDFYDAPMLNIYDAQDCVGADGEKEYTSCNCLNCAAVDQSNGFAEAAQMSVVKPKTMMEIDGTDHFVLSEDQEIPDGIKLDFGANQGMSMQSNGFAEAAQMSVVKPGNVDHFWPIGDDLENPIARGLDFNSDVGWIRPKMIRNGW